ncbi:His-Xaa-Ser system radical SAM maturase HxsC [Sulfitobacter sp. JL08]|uniref:His-Xaa-Ser system radical SAM maturase HxsC n=1 Tax=Sulfitobacter sp. JL08 TaxID=2070369 RepID=UPI00196427A0|nr:His-Xaa-Ser system radical SAM maturase HxsC [Sulfitobacter sp. JL08]
MINLQLPIECSLQNSGPFVCRVEMPSENRFGEKGLALETDGKDGSVGNFEGLKIFFPGVKAEELYGDVLLVVPGHQTASRLIRCNSHHNTLLFTEQCDQLCVMCSQPPKRINDQWRLPFYKEAVRLADEGIPIGISGGEPTLQRDLFFDLLEDIVSSRPDIKLHILTNGQHFRDEDVPTLRRLNEECDILWGVPLYAPEAESHDRIVFKDGAFEVLMPNLFRLASAKAKIELRTVLTGMNYPQLPSLANFISKNLFFLKVWAIMGLEPTGFAKAFREDLFVDHSVFFEPLEHALDIAKLRRIPTTLYNIPLCTVPPQYRKYCADTISDWKKKYLPECAPCEKRDSCSGFFEWYNESWRFEEINPLSAKGESL